MIVVLSLFVGIHAVRADRAYLRASFDPSSKVMVNQAVVGASSLAAFQWLHDHVARGDTVANQPFVDGSLWMYAQERVAPLTGPYVTGTTLAPDLADRLYLVHHLGSLGRDARADALARRFQTRWVFYDSNLSPVGRRILNLGELRHNPRLKVAFHEGTTWVFRIDLSPSSEATAKVWPGLEWERRDGAALGADGELIAAAVALAARREASEARAMASYLGSILAPQTYAEVIGPLLDSSGTSGVVVYRGYLVGEWGDPAALEMSFSATKSYLSLVAGLAFDRGLIRDVREPVIESVEDAAFEAARHRRISWEHLLQQTSEWGGHPWTKPYWADPQGGQTQATPLGASGTVWAYNDVRINLLALALTRLWGRSLHDVLRSEVMTPIGASTASMWHGYTNATVDIAGRDVDVVSGGAHWGGGLWASAYDHARAGLLYLHAVGARQRSPDPTEWIDATTRPCELNPDYGYLWWLNRRGRVFPHAPDSGYCARGNLGRQLVWVDPRDLVIVSRWSDGVGELLETVSRAIRSTSELVRVAVVGWPACPTHHSTRPWTSSTASSRASS